MGKASITLRFKMTKWVFIIPIITFIIGWILGWILGYVDRPKIDEIRT